jgi:hypothetical protein
LLLAAIALLAIPAVSMLFGGEFVWSFMDFVIAGALLTFAALTIDYAWGRATSRNLRLAAVATILFVLILIWAELAVGLFGTPFAGS